MNRPPSLFLTLFIINANNHLIRRQCDEKYPQLFASPGINDLDHAINHTGL